MHPSDRSSLRRRTRAGNRLQREIGGVNLKLVNPRPLLLAAAVSTLADSASYRGPGTPSRKSESSSARWVSLRPGSTYRANTLARKRRLMAGAARLTASTTAAATRRSARVASAVGWPGNALDATDRQRVEPFLLRRRPRADIEFYFSRLRDRLYSVYSSRRLTGIIARSPRWQ